MLNWTEILKTLKLVVGNAEFCEKLIATQEIIRHLWNLNVYYRIN